MWLGTFQYFTVSLQVSQIKWAVGRVWEKGRGQSWFTRKKFWKARNKTLARETTNLAEKSFCQLWQKLWKKIYEARRVKQSWSLEPILELYGFFVKSKLQTKLFAKTTTIQFFFNSSSVIPILHFNWIAAVGQSQTVLFHPLLFGTDLFAVSNQCMRNRLNQG